MGSWGATDFMRSGLSATGASLRSWSMRMAGEHSVIEFAGRAGMGREWGCG